MVDNEADHWAHLNRRIDEMFGVIAEIRSNIVSAKRARLASLSGRGIFIVGHARSGTSVLLEAINTASDVCCLGEPYLYRSMYQANFSEMFNAMNEGFGNPPIKGYWVPRFDSGTGFDIMERLASTYRYVGEKVAFRQREKDYNTEAFFEFAVERFPQSAYLCLVRDPLVVTSSVLEMFESASLRSDIVKSVLRSQLEVYLLILRLVLTLPNVHVLVHERINNDLLAKLAVSLDIDLSGAMNLYDKATKVAPHSLDRQLSKDENLRLVRDKYRAICDLVPRGKHKVPQVKVIPSRTLCISITKLLADKTRMT